SADAVRASRECAAAPHWWEATAEQGGTATPQRGSGSRGGHGQRSLRFPLGGEGRSGGVRPESDAQPVAGRDVSGSGRGSTADRTASGVLSLAFRAHHGPTP